MLAAVSTSRAAFDPGEAVAASCGPRHPVDMVVMRVSLSAVRFRSTWSSEVSRSTSALDLLIGGPPSFRTSPALGSTACWGSARQ